jgi:hypothetical protein
MILRKARKMPIVTAALIGLFVTEIAQAQYSPHTGTTTSPSTEGVRQPNGSTGPLTTGSGGAPASSPQGETPPNMQAAPEGSSKSTNSPDDHSK